MKRLLAFLLLLVPSMVLAQSPSGLPAPVLSPPYTVWTPSQWSAFFAHEASKVDGTNGILTNPMLNGTLAAIGSSTWTSATFPGVGNMALYESLSYTGAPTVTAGGFHDGSGYTIPFNFINITNDQIAWTPPAGGVSALEVRHLYGGGAATGGRNTVLIDSVLNGAIASGSNNNYVSLQAFLESNANVAGAAAGSGNGKGSFFTVGVSCLLGGSTNVFAHELSCQETDFQPNAGSSYDYGSGIKIINFGPSGMHANVFETALQISATAAPASASTFNNGIYFGDPQATDGKGFGVSATGTIIGAPVGSTANGIDFSNVTFSNAIMLGPNGFEIEPNGHVDTNAIYSSANSLTIQDAQGNPAMAVNRGAVASVNYVLTSSNTTGNAPQYHSTGSDATVGMAFKTDKGSGSFQWLNTSGAVQFQVNGVASAISYPQITPVAAGNPLISVGGTGANLLLGSSGALATTATTGFPVVPTSAGPPTGAATVGSIVVDTTNSHVCVLISGTTWHCV